jgi:hypothetical protein
MIAATTGAAAPTETEWCKGSQPPLDVAVAAPECARKSTATTSTLVVAHTQWRGRPASSSSTVLAAEALAAMRASTTAAEAPFWTAVWRGRAPQFNFADAPAGNASTRAATTAAAASLLS